MTTVSGVIMAHPDRWSWAESLSEKTGLDIVWDEGGPATSDPKRRWAVGRECWERGLSSGAQWHLVLQDDALVCRDLIPGLGLALEPFNGRGVVSAYCGSGRPDQVKVRQAVQLAEAEKSNWVTTMSLNWGVGIILPTNTIAGMLEWCSDSGRAKDNYDYRIGCYYRDVLGWRSFYAHPSLVDHRDQGSLVGHFLAQRRVAHQFVGEDVSALDIDWSRLPSKGVAPELQESRAGLYPVRRPPTPNSPRRRPARGV